MHCRWTNFGKINRWGRATVEPIVHPRLKRYRYHFVICTPTHTMFQFRDFIGFLNSVESEYLKLWSLKNPLKWYQSRTNFLGNEHRKSTFQLLRRRLGGWASSGKPKGRKMNFRLVVLWEWLRVWYHLNWFQEL